MDKPRILFLGIHNTTVTLMAEALMRKQAGDDFEIYSAGIQPFPVEPELIQVLEEAGCSVSGIYSKDFSDLIGQTAFSVIVQIRLNIEHFDPRLPLPRLLLHWTIAGPDGLKDPCEDKLSHYRFLLEETNRKVSQLILDLQHHPVRLA